MQNPSDAPSPYTPPVPASVSPIPNATHTEGDGTGGVIPYKNPQALIAYYLGIFSLFPCFGFPLGVAAIVLGFKGLKARKLNPIVRGHVHAWIGIVLGILGMIPHALIGFGIAFAIVQGAR